MPPNAHPGEAARFAQVSSGGVETADVGVIGAGAQGASAAAWVGPRGIDRSPRDAGSSRRVVKRQVDPERARPEVHDAPGETSRRTELHRPLERASLQDVDGAAEGARLGNGRGPT